MSYEYYRKQIHESNGENLNEIAEIMANDEELTNVEYTGLYLIALRKAQEIGC